MFDLTLKGRVWTLSLVVRAYKGPGPSLLALAEGTIPGKVPDADVAAEALKAAAKVLRQEIRDLELDGE